MFENYFVDPDKEIYNIWQVRDGSWNLMVDENNHPLEFDWYNASLYVGINKLTKYVNNFKKNIPECEEAKSFQREGLVTIRRAPTKPSLPMQSLSVEEVNNLITSWEITDLVFRKFLVKFLTAPDKYLQARLYMQVLSAPGGEDHIREWLKNSEFGKALTNFICSGDTYTEQIARLEIWMPPQIYGSEIESILE